MIFLAAMIFATIFGLHNLFVITDIMAGVLW